MNVDDIIDDPKLARQVFVRIKQLFEADRIEELRELFAKVPAEPSEIKDMALALGLLGPDGILHGRMTKKEALLLAVLKSIVNPINDTLGVGYNCAIAQSVAKYVPEFYISIDGQSRREIIDFKGAGGLVEGLNMIGKLKEKIGDVQK